MNRFGGVLQGLLDERGLRGPADLSELLAQDGHDVPAEKIVAFMEGKQWVDGWFPIWVAETLDLDSDEMGALALAVTYGQAEYPP